MIAGIFVIGGFLLLAAVCGCGAWTLYVGIACWIVGAIMGVISFVTE